MDQWAKHPATKVAPEVFVNSSRPPLVRSISTVRGSWEEGVKWGSLVHFNSHEGPYRALSGFVRTTHEVAKLARILRSSGWKKKWLLNPSTETSLVDFHLLHSPERYLLQQPVRSNRPSFRSNWPSYLCLVVRESWNVGASLMKRKRLHYTAWNCVLPILFYFTKTFLSTSCFAVGYIAPETTSFLIEPL